MVAFALGTFAQKRTTQLTLYKQFKPSTITLSNGRTIKQSLTNVFLKNSSLVYMNGDNAMEANMENIAKVEFDDRTFYNVNNQLAYIVDSVGYNIIYRIDIFDLEAYNQQIRNNVNITAIPSFTGDMISTTTATILICRTKVISSSFRFTMGISTNDTPITFPSTSSVPKETGTT
jgi:hypothetical protein